MIFVQSCMSVFAASTWFKNCAQQCHYFGSLVYCRSLALSSHVLSTCVYVYTYIYIYMVAIPIYTCINLPRIGVWALTLQLISPIVKAKSEPTYGYDWH